MAFETLPLRPFDFFVKPYEINEVKGMLDRLKRKMKKEVLMGKMDQYVKTFKAEPKRVFRQKKGIIVLNLEEIVICRACLSKTILTLTCGEEVQLSDPLSHTIEIINCSRFLKVSRSFWINRDYLRKIDRRKHKCDLYYEGKTWQVPVSRSAENMLESLLTFPVL